MSHFSPRYQVPLSTWTPLSNIDKIYIASCFRQQRRRRRRRGEACACGGRFRRTRDWRTTRRTATQLLLLLLLLQPFLPSFVLVSFGSFRHHRRPQSSCGVSLSRLLHVTKVRYNSCGKSRAVRAEKSFQSSRSYRLPKSKCSAVIVGWRDPRMVGLIARVVKVPFQRELSSVAVSRNMCNSRTFFGPFLCSNLRNFCSLVLSPTYKRSNFALVPW